MNKVDFKKYFESGYKEIVFTANNGKTSIYIESNYSVPSSKVSSFITHINGTLYEEKRWGFFFKELIEIQSNLRTDVYIGLDKFEVDPEEFDEESFFEHLIIEASKKIQESDYASVLQQMSVV